MDTISKALTSDEHYIPPDGALVVPATGDVKAVEIVWSDRSAYSDSHYWYTHESETRQLGESVYDIIRVSEHEQGFIVENLSEKTLRVLANVYR